MDDFIKDFHLQKEGRHCDFNGIGQAIELHFSYIHLNDNVFLHKRYFILDTLFAVDLALGDFFNLRLI